MVLIENYRWNKIYSRNNNDPMSDTKILECWILNGDNHETVKVEFSLNDLIEALNILKNKLDPILDSNGIGTQKEFKKEEFRNKVKKRIINLYIYPLNIIIKTLNSFINSFFKKKWNSLNKFDKAHHRLNNTELYKRNENSWKWGKTPILANNLGEYLK